MTSTKTPRRGLGRGLGSLIPTAPAADAEGADAPGAEARPDGARAGLR